MRASCRVKFRERNRGLTCGDGGGSSLKVNELYNGADENVSAALSNDMLEKLT